MTDFAAAVQAFEAAVERFDAPPAPSAPRPQRLVDAGPLLEQMALERETAMAASTSKARQATRPVESLAPRPYAHRGVTPEGILGVLSRGPANAKQIATATGLLASSVTYTLRRMERKGTVKRAGGGEATPHGMTPMVWKAAVNTQPVRVNKAAEGPREVETMPTGVKLTNDAILAAMDGYDGSTTGALAERIGVEQTSVAIRLRGMRKDGRVHSIRGPGTGGAMLWKIGGSEAAGKAKQVTTPRGPVAPKGQEATEAFPPLKFAPLSQIDKGPGAKAPFAVVGVGIPLAAELGRLAEAIEREAKRRAAVSLRAEADRLDAEAAGGGT